MRKKIICKIIVQHAPKVPYRQKHLCAPVTHQQIQIKFYSNSMAQQHKCLEHNTTVEKAAFRYYKILIRVIRDFWDRQYLYTIMVQIHSDSPQSWSPLFFPLIMVYHYSTLRSHTRSITIIIWLRLNIQNRLYKYITCVYNSQQTCVCTYPYRIIINLGVGLLHFSFDKIILNYRRRRRLLYTLIKIKFLPPWDRLTTSRCLSLADKLNLSLLL